MSYPEHCPKYWYKTEQPSQKSCAGCESHHYPKCLAVSSNSYSQGLEISRVGSEQEESDGF